MNFTTVKGFLPKNIIVFVLIATLLVILHGQGNGQGKTKAVIPSVFHWEYASPESQGMSTRKLDSMRNILAEKNTRKLLVIKNDKIVYEWFAPGWEDSVKKHSTASLAKALVGGMSLLAALDDEYIHFDEPACNYIHPWKTDNRKSKITIRQLATHTSGLEDAESSETMAKIIQSKGLNPHMDLPGWKGQFWRHEPDPFLMARDSTPVIFTPGEEYIYSNPGIAMLTYAVTASLKDSRDIDIRTYLKERIYGPIGIDEEEYVIGYNKIFTAGNLQLTPSWGGGAFTARAVARIGMLMLHKGNWQGQQILDTSLVEKATNYGGTALPPLPCENKKPDSNTRSKNNPIPATTPGWYSNYDGVWNNVPRDAFAGAGAGNQHLLVIPSLKMVVVRMGKDLYNKSGGEGYWLGAEKYLFNPLMDAIEEAPYPKSNITAEFAPKETVIRMAKGSDNWPITWGNDGALYTAYGDGNGFSPNTDIKLSLGIAKVDGNPPSLEAVNIRSRTGEKVGQGKNGEKASGLLMVNGVLYMLTRNAQNAGLMWSDDYGKTWEESLWKFDVSFGYPTFLNYGKNYEGATDNYVYIYSHDEANAYKNSDNFVLARVPKNQIKNWREYEFFAGYGKGNEPEWSEDIRKREPVFTNPGKCYRSGITYNKGLKRFLWCQVIQLSPSKEYTDIRFRGGLGIFESHNPWGPWKTVYYTRDWDIGPGDASCIPSKWMSNDGKTCYLLFSGDDYFSLRQMAIIQN